MKSILQILGLKTPLCEYSKKCTEYRDNSYTCNEETCKKTYCAKYREFGEEKHGNKKKPPRGALPLGF